MVEGIDHVFTWKMLFSVPKNKAITNNLEAKFITVLKPSLNEQK